ncbi:hypothetical protein F4778DRAFT_606081 [Xylariomycetidae sp. FL2044]|nr:hypothetical protein F4778DRAFT_606081 [Xylariomycetidae sp. FL2044]
MPEINPLAAPPEATDSPVSASASVSQTTLPIAGLKVDIYGLGELPATATSVSCLWLHHPRLRRKEDMADIARQILSAFHHQQQQNKNSSPSCSSRGLIAVAFDQRNHGSRLIDDRANESWKKGNGTHAQDMFGTVTGTVVDTLHLLDALEGYDLFGAASPKPSGTGPDDDDAALRSPGGGGNGGGNSGERSRKIDQHIVLGVSLGGHSAWQTLFAEPRVTAGVLVIGCPDYMRLMQDRARKSKLPTYSKQDGGATFLGSRDFPPALVGACHKYDPRGILFGAAGVPVPTATPIPTSEQQRLRPLLDARVRGKRFQVLSGGADKLVPYAAGVPFLDVFKEAAGGWYKDGGVYLEDNVYPEAGHEFSAEMRRDAVRFILDTVALADDDDDENTRKPSTPRI